MECIIKKPDGSTIQMTDTLLKHQVAAGAVGRAWAARADRSEDWSTVESLLGLGSSTTEAETITTPEPTTTPTAPPRQSRLALTFLILALAVPVLTIVLNLGHEQPALSIGKGEWRQSSGSVFWRYFQWGVRDTSSSFAWRLEDAGFSRSTAAALDVTNPTPFMITIFFLGLSFVTRAFAKPKA